ncbi:MAG: glycosyltransferase [Cyclobacteriaceae bacterium]
MELFIICCAILGIQIIYLLLFLFAFRKQDSIQSMDRPGISVIVCAHDEEDNLRQLVPLLLSQTYPQFEVIVVEDRCNDGTYDYLLQATKVHSQLKMVRVTHKPEHINGKKFALTLGIKAAQYDWVLLTDADCRPVSNLWIESVAQNIGAQSEIVIGFSPYAKENSLLNAFIRFESFLAGIQFIGLALLGKPYMGVGRNLAYNKKLFLDNKGFNSHLSITGGDDDLFVNQHATAKNVSVNISKESVVMSKPKSAWKEFFQQKLRHLSVGKRYKFSDKLILGLFSLSWVFSWIIVVPVAPFLLWWKIIMGFFLLRWILLATVMSILPKKLGDSFEAWKIPLLDFMFAFYYLVIGAKALVVKKVKWKS